MSQNNAPAGTPIVTSIQPFLGGIDAWICDIWGVVHNGLAAFPGAVDACVRFRETSGTVLLLTNAPRPAAAIVEQLEKLKVPKAAYDAVLSSGDLTLALIDEHKSKPIAHVGPPRDRGLFDGRPLRLTAIAEAEVIVCSGLDDDERETAEDYRARLEGPAARGVPLICANPDVTVARGNKVIPCAGAIAAVYETLGGSVIYAGKPYLPVYDRAFQMIEALRGKPLDRRAVLAIGDGVNTDIKGALTAGLKPVFVASPVHHPEPLEPESLERAMAKLPGRPIAAMAALAW
jgi:HAD superfamily hydrolase (TIGR01459 family)